MCLVDCSFGHKKKCLAIFFDDVTNTSLARVWCVLWFVCTLTFVDRTSHHPHSTSPPEHKRTKKEKKNEIVCVPIFNKTKIRCRQCESCRSIDYDHPHPSHILHLLHVFLVCNILQQQQQQQRDVATVATVSLVVRLQFRRLKNAQD